MADSKFQIAIAIKDPLDSTRIENLLNSDGYDPTVFHNAQELWESFARYRPRFVIVDRRFTQGFDGLQLSRNIRNQFMLPFVYILMLSRLNSLEEIEEGLDAGVSDYLIKPNNPFQIRSRIRVGLRWLGYVDSALANS